jgi:hypothetical protein
VHASCIEVKKSEAKEDKRIRTRAEKHTAPFETPFATQGKQGRDAEN